jgi:hypothetical protein
MLDAGEVGDEAGRQWNDAALMALREMRHGETSSREVDVGPAQPAQISHAYRAVGQHPHHRPRTLGEGSQHHRDLTLRETPQSGLLAPRNIELPSHVGPPVAPPAPAVELPPGHDTKAPRGARQGRPLGDDRFEILDRYSRWIGTRSEPIHEESHGTRIGTNRLGRFARRFEALSPELDCSIEFRRCLAHDAPLGYARGHAEPIIAAVDSPRPGEPRGKRVTPSGCVPRWPGGGS